MPMKFVTEKNVLVDALTRCAQITSQHSPQILHRNVLLTAAKGLTIQANTESRAILFSVPDANVESAGAACLPAKELLERVKLLPEGNVVVTVDGHTATLKTSGKPRRFSLQGMDPALFPPFQAPTYKPTKQLKTTTHAVDTLLSAVLHAASTDTGRPMLNSVWLTAGSEGIKATATDGNCLSSARVGSEPQGSDWLIPLNAARDLKAFCATKADEEVTLKEFAGRLYVEFQTFEFSTLLAIGESFVWDRPVCERTARLDRKALLDGIKAVSASCGMAGGVALEFATGQLTLRAASSGAGDAFDEIPMVFSGDDVTVGVDPKLAMATLSVLGCDEIEVGTSGEFNRLVITVPGRSEFIAIISPMRV